jgi:hypothetical protein
VEIPIFQKLSHGGSTHLCTDWAKALVLLVFRRGQFRGLQLAKDPPGGHLIKQGRIKRATATLTIQGEQQ